MIVLAFLALFLAVALRWFAFAARKDPRLQGVAAHALGLASSMLLAVALVALNAMGPTFWCLPRAVLQGTAAAGGIALINAVGNLGGFAGPNVLGVIKNATGTYAVALWMLAAGGLVAAGLLVGFRTKAGGRVGAKGAKGAKGARGFAG